MTLANRLTIIRILMTPGIAVLLLYHQTAAALALFLLAGLTDALDGFVARTRGQRTTLGMVLDPLADKLLMISVVLVLTSLKELPRWFMIIILSRDLILVGGALVVHMFVGKRDHPPSWLGKATTAAQIVTVLFAMLDNLVPAVLPLVFPAATIAAALTVASGIHYVFRGARYLND
jgi:cardiolipin synthase